MARRKKKHEPIKVEAKKPWEVSRGHQEHITGAGEHEDRRTKRNRTRSAQKRKAIEEYND